MRNRKPPVAAAKPPVLLPIRPAAPRGGPKKKMSRKASLMQVTAHQAVQALAEQIMAAHTTTNELMKVQFAAVDKNFERVHETMAEVKRDLKKETEDVKIEVAANRLKNEDRHLSLVKKVWLGGGILVAVEALLQFIVLKK